MPGGHASDPAPAAIFRSFRAQGILYFFGKINHSTDKMLEV